MADSKTNPQSNTTATPSNNPQTAGPASKDGPNREEISRRAYELFQKRGGKHGYHMNDWQEAERQLRKERQGGAAGGATTTAKTTAKKSAAKKATAEKTTAKKSAAKKSAAKTTAKKSAAKKSAAKKSAAKKTGGKG